jgi:hypothetical protein
VWCVLFELGVILCDMCIFVLCLIVVPLPQGKTPFAVQLNNNNKIIIVARSIFAADARSFPLSGRFNSEEKKVKGR